LLRELRDCLEHARDRQAGGDRVFSGDKGCFFVEVA
jgi:hypothetical protein